PGRLRVLAGGGPGAIDQVGRAIGDALLRLIALVRGELAAADRPVDVRVGGAGDGVDHILGGVAVVLGDLRQRMAGQLGAALLDTDAQQLGHRLGLLTKEGATAEAAARPTGTTREATLTVRSGR